MPLFQNAQEPFQILGKCFSVYADESAKAEEEEKCLEEARQEIKEEDESFSNY
jgi:hypothetical protein